jgi:hypothetical protein
MFIRTLWDSKHVCGSVRFKADVYMLNVVAYSVMKGNPWVQCFLIYRTSSAFVHVFHIVRAYIKLVQILLFTVQDFVLEYSFHAIMKWNIPRNSKSMKAVLQREK